MFIVPKRLYLSLSQMEVIIFFDFCWVKKEIYISFVKQINFRNKLFKNNYYKFGKHGKTVSRIFQTAT